VTTPRTPITPAAFEAEMHDLDDRLESLRLQLVDARNCENDAKRDFEIAKVTAVSACETGRGHGGRAAGLDR
jgi:hypothetical protein